jgi:cysteine desulfurase
LGIMGFGAAADYGKLLIGASGGIAALRDELEQRLLDISPDATIFGIDANRLYNTSLFSVPGIKAETALIALDLEGIAVSSGAACSSGKVAASHVLAAMGVPPSLASGAIRVSLGATSGAHDIELFLKAWRKLVMGLSKGKRGLAA